MKATHVTQRPAIWIATKYFYFWVIDIVIPSRDSIPGLRVSVYLNLTHALNRSVTTAGLPKRVVKQKKLKIKKIILLSQTTFFFYSVTGVYIQLSVKCLSFERNLFSANEKDTQAFLSKFGV